MYKSEQVKHVTQVNVYGNISCTFKLRD